MEENASSNIQNEIKKTGFPTELEIRVTLYRSI
jgi:hypothetical protein